MVKIETKVYSQIERIRTYQYFKTLRDDEIINAALNHLEINLKKGL
jgi:uncharacterized protein YydD (DUF2326 family)